MASTTPQTIPGVRNIIAVSSGKGGVGKSTVSVNLASALALKGFRVGLMDADVYGPNIPTMMGVIDEPKIVNHAERGELFVPPVAHGVKVMSMGFLVQGDQPLAWRGPMLHNVVRQFCFQVEWGELDYLIIDMPPGTGDIQLSISQLVAVRGAILVTTPQEVSMQDVRKAYTMFEKVRIPLIGIVENMSYFVAPGTSTKQYIFGQGGGERLAKRYQTELLAQVPLVQTIREGGDEGKPVVIRESDSEAAVLFAKMADRVVAISDAMSNEAYGPHDIIQIGKFD